MATVMTPRGRTYLGPGLILDYGDYSCTDTSTITVTVAGGLVIAAQFFDGQQGLCANAGTTSTVTLSSKSLSSTTNCTTYTLTPGGTAVTGGSYYILHGGA